MRCQYESIYPQDIKRHSSRCMFVQMDQELEQLQTHFTKELSNQQKAFQIELNRKEIEISHKDSEIAHLQGKLECLESQMKHSNELVTKLAERPTTVFSNSNLNNGNSTHITNILTDHKRYLEQTDHARIEAIAREKLEPFFFQGQKGAAEFAVENIIFANDDSDKMIAACTDFARKKVRYMNEKDEIDEDIGASKLVKRIAPPIKIVATELHTNITEKLKKDLEDNKIKSYIADGKSTMANNAWLDILKLDNDDQNVDFRTKLCSLMKV